MQYIIGLFALVALIGAVLIFFQLIKLVGYIATHATFNIVGVFLGFALSLLLDIKLLTLAASFLTYVALVNGGYWKYYSIAFSAYLFLVCSFNIIVLMVENLKKTNFGKKISPILRPFEYDFDSLGEVDEKLPDIIRMGVAFWGGAGLYFGFTFLVLMLSQMISSGLLFGNAHLKLDFEKSFLFSLQSWADVIPVVATASAQQFSSLKVTWHTWPSKGLMLLTLAYQALIYPALYNFVVKLLESTHGE
ncbi:hypothetical protein [Oceanidesulfovibrio marinus]|uniref:hypothetical protein n=1 Tax=Oceanidesulfovibrio marinus TaxID=370038 RepID=UPI001182D7DF|nr:hypothetical protein [Oceanidesulfovibrio marinus]